MEAHMTLVYAVRALRIVSWLVLVLGILAALNALNLSPYVPMSTVVASILAALALLTGAVGGWALLVIIAAASEHIEVIYRHTRDLDFSE
jgi:hypothetical protein